MVVGLCRQNGPTQCMLISPIVDASAWVDLDSTDEFVDVPDLILADANGHKPEPRPAALLIADQLQACASRRHRITANRKVHDVRHCYSPISRRSAAIAFQASFLRMAIRLRRSFASCQMP